MIDASHNVAVGMGQDAVAWMEQRAPNCLRCGLENYQTWEAQDGTIYWSIDVVIREQRATLVFRQRPGDGVATLYQVIIPR